MRRPLASGYASLGRAIQNITLQIMPVAQDRDCGRARLVRRSALEWAINCDFRLFSESARWFFPEVTYGLFVTEA